MVFNRGSEKLFLMFRKPRKDVHYGWFSGGNCNPG